MTIFSFGPEDGLYYEYHPPETSQGVTYVFFNALTGDTAAWESAIAPSLRSGGNGTLSFNYRGQTNSPFSSGLLLDENLIVKDSIELLKEIQPQKPVFVGLSIGGLFAAKSYLSGSPCSGLVLINTLRQDGHRLKWIGDALVRAAAVGGLELFRDLYLPLLMNETWLGENRNNFLQDDADYIPLESDSGHYKLLSEAGRSSNWDIPYEDISIPCLVITGLQDHVFLDANVVDTLFSRLPDGRRIDMSSAGHLIPAENPEELIDHILAFTKEAI